MTRLLSVAVWLGLVSAVGYAHPLDDLSAEEIARAVSAIRASKRFPESIRFPILATKEPEKKALLAGKAQGRLAAATVLDPPSGKFWDVVVDLEKNQVTSAEEQKGSQPPILLEEYEITSKLIREDARWLASIKKRGIDNPDDVAIDSWVPGLMSKAEKKGGARLMRGVPYLRGKNENYYGRPIEGLIATVDIGKKKVIEVVDTGVVPIAKGSVELSEAANGPVRTTLKPIVIERPEGVSFKIEKGEVQWEHWRFRFSLHPQKGLTIYQVGYEDGGKIRPIAYKVGLSEMVVPYGDPDATWTFRNAFDLGEYGVGRTSHSLDPLVDTPVGTQFFDAVFAEDGGTTYNVPRAIGLYERETGLLWKHVDQATHRGEARRSRELVLTFMTTVGNYDYGIDYVFYLDGTLEVQAALTGMVQAKGTKLTENPCVEGCSHLVEANILAPNHQHFFAFRADLDVDGPKNQAVEMNVKAIASTALNPARNAFDAFLTPLKSEKAAARELNLATSRKWKVMSSSEKNALKHPTGYALIPGENAVPYLAPESPIRKRASFVNHPVWFTRYKDAEQGAAGTYPNQHLTGDGLTRFIADNEKLENEDVVLWYVFGITHVTRPEEWPIMNVHRAGFKLIPVNFFSRNPGMDLPAVSAKLIEAARDK